MQRLDQVVVLGHVISKARISVDPSEVEAVRISALKSYYMMLCILLCMTLCMT